MKWSDLPLKPDSRILRQFAAAWLLIFLALAARQHFAHHHRTASLVLVVLSLIGVVGLLKPGAVRWLFVGATIAAFPLGWVVTQITLAAMFYLILTPIALWFRWRGRDELRLRPKAPQDSSWVKRGEPPSPEKYLKQF